MLIKSSSTIRLENIATRLMRIGQSIAVILAWSDIFHILHIYSIKHVINLEVVATKP